MLSFYGVTFSDAQFAAIAAAVPSLEALDVGLRYLRSEPDGDRSERSLRIKGPLDESQRARLADVAERTPVTLAIKGGVAIHTEIEEGDAA